MVKSRTPPPEISDWLSPKQCMVQLGRSYMGVLALLHRGRLIGRRIGRDIYVDPQSIDKVLNTPVRFTKDENEAA
jgi:hypothetical protein